MTDTISISKQHFIGNGPTPFLVSGRVPNDDDDSVRLIMATDNADAIDIFTQNLHEDSSLDEEDIERIKSNHGGESIFIIDCYPLT